MTRASRRRHALPWFLSLLLGAVAVAAWLRGVPSSDGGSARVVEATPDAGRAPESGEREARRAAEEAASATLALCLERLERASPGASSELTPALDVGPDAGLDEAARACIARPDVARAALDRARRDLDAERAEARASRARAVRAMLAGALSLSDDDVAWLGERVCAVRRLRDATLADIARGDGDPAASFAQLSREREAVLTDVEARVGAERFASLRAIGGVGLIADSIACD